MGTQNLAAVILVGHGGIPKDCPPDLVMKLKRLESQRRAHGAPPSQEEMALDHQIRQWPRTPETDPYKAGLEALGSRLQAQLEGIKFALAYNEFCAPTLEEASERLISAGVGQITIVSSMFTPGGSHSEIEIPNTLHDLQKKYPNVSLTYAWPFDLGAVAEMLVGQITKFHNLEFRNETKVTS